MPLVGKASTPKKNPQTGTTEAWFGGSRQGKTVWSERTGSVGDQGEATEEREEAACARREREKRICVRHSELERE